MVTTDAKVKKLMEEIQKGAPLGVAALRADMGRKTASKYKGLAKLPSELKEPRTWRTREDPFAPFEAWPSLMRRGQAGHHASLGRGRKINARCR